jgi:hypothetical protein
MLEVFIPLEVPTELVAVHLRHDDIADDHR